MPEGWLGEVGDDPPLVHQQVAVGTESETGTQVQDDTATTPDPFPAVVVLVTDGARIDETFGDGTSSVTGEPTVEFLPRIRAELLPQGAVLERAVNAGVTITAEGHASLVTGRRIALPNMPSTNGAGDFRPEVPTLLEWVRRSLDADQDAVVVGGNTVHLRPLTMSQHPLGGEDQSTDYHFVTSPTDPSQPVGDDGAVIDSIQEWMEAHPTRLVVANLHQMDRAGHYGTGMAYAEGVKAVDDRIVEFWDWIQAHPTYQDQTTLIVVADHGRHRLGTPDDHRQHGDSCSGCRQVPLLMVGPGIRPGVRSNVTVTLTDVAATIAELLEIELPHATGRVIAEVLISPPDNPEPVGVGDPVTAEGHDVAREWVPDSERRSVILLDGERVSTEGVLHAEAPVLASRGPLTVACWRELALNLGEIETSPWASNCKHTTSDGTWVDFRFPGSPVSPYFRPALAIDPSGQLWSAFVDNITGNSASFSEMVRIHRWTASRSWEEAGTGIDTVTFALHPTIVPTPTGALLAVVTSDTPGEAETPPHTEEIQGRARFRRHIQVYRVHWPPADAEATVQQTWRGYTSDHYVEDALLPAPDDAWEGWADIGRADRPVLAKGDGPIHLAFVAMGAEGGENRLLHQQSTDQGTTWSDPEIIDSGDVVVHIAPAFSGDDLYWARSAADGVSICRWTETTGSSCQLTEAEAIDGLSVTGTTWTAGLRVDGTWQVRSEAW